MVYLVTAVVNGKRTLEIFSCEEKAKASVLGRTKGASIRSYPAEAAERCVRRHEELHGA